MEIEIYNKVKYINIWFNDKTKNLFKNYHKSTDLTEILNNIPEYYPFIPHYNGNTITIDLMKKN